MAARQVEEASLLYQQLQHVCRFIEGITGTPCTGTTDLFTHGVHLALLAHHLAPHCVPLTKIYDRTLVRYEGAGNLPSFRHLDNINLFIASLDELCLPKVLYPECRDVYEGHNLAKLVYCLRALEQQLGRCVPVLMAQDTQLPSGDLLERLSESMQGCKMPSFDNIAEVLASCHVTAGGVSTAPHHPKFTPVKKLLSRQPVPIGKENVQEFAAPRSGRTQGPPKPPKPEISGEGLHPPWTPRQGRCQPAVTSANRPSSSCPNTPKHERALVTQSPFMLRDQQQQVVHGGSGSHHLTPSAQQLLQQQAVEGRQPLQVLQESNKAPSTMQEWVTQQRLQRSGTKPLPGPANPDVGRKDSSMGRSFTPKKLFNPESAQEQSDDFIENFITNDSPLLKRNTIYRNESPDLRPNPPYSPTSWSYTKASPHENGPAPQFIYPRQESPRLAPDAFYSATHSTTLQPQQSARQLSAASPARHSRTPSSPLQFVKPLSPRYRLSSHKSNHNTSVLPITACARSSTLRSSTQLVECNGDVSSLVSCYSSTSVPSSPLKEMHELPLSTSCEELSVIVSEAGAARYHSSSSLKVLHTSHADQHRNSASNLHVFDRDQYGSVSSLLVRAIDTRSHSASFDTADLFTNDGAFDNNPPTEHFIANNNCYENDAVSNQSIEDSIAEKESAGVRECLSQLHCSLQSGSEVSTLAALEALRSHYPALPPVLPHAAPLYHIEMYEAMVDAQCALSLEEVCGGVALVRAVAAINTAVRTEDHRALTAALTDTAAHMQDVSASLVSEYLSAMRKALEQLAAVSHLAGGEGEDVPGGGVCSMLTFLHTQQIVDQVNTAAEDRLSVLARGEELSLTSDEEENKQNTYIVSSAALNQVMDDRITPPPYQSDHHHGLCGTITQQTLAAGHTDNFQSYDDSQSITSNLVEGPPSTAFTVGQDPAPSARSPSPTTAQFVSPLTPQYRRRPSQLSQVSSPFLEQMSKSSLTQDIFASLSQDVASALSKDITHTSRSSAHVKIIMPPDQSDDVVPRINCQGFSSVDDKQFNELDTPDEPSKQCHQSHSFEKSASIPFGHNSSSVSLKTPYSLSFNSDDHRTDQSIIIHNSNVPTDQPIVVGTQDQQSVEVSIVEVATSSEPIYAYPNKKNKKNRQAPRTPSASNQHLPSNAQLNSVHENSHFSHSQPSPLNPENEPQYHELQSHLRTPQQQQPHICEPQYQELRPNPAPQTQPSNGRECGSQYHSVRPQPQVALQQPHLQYRKRGDQAACSTSDTFGASEPIYQSVPCGTLGYESLHADLDLSNRLSHTSLTDTAVRTADGTACAASKVMLTSGYLPKNGSSWTDREVVAVTCLQRWWRTMLALSRLQRLLQKTTAEGAGAVGRPFSTSELLPVLAPCLPLLPLTETDLRTEKRLQVVRSGVSRCLRVTTHLQQEVDHLDLQIGLLLSNTMTIQDPNMSALFVGMQANSVSCGGQDGLDPLACVGGALPSSGKKATIKKEAGQPERRGTLTVATGLKALRKCSRDRLQGYQELFYLLQTRPRYLATLIFALPTAKTTRFVESVVFSLYNYGANDRDSFLLINLFKTALEEEIRCKVLRISDIVSGEPLVVKMIVSFVRKGPGRAALREVLGPLVAQVLEDKKLNLNTNPVEIYQTWLNEIEMETGQSSGSPYNVSPEEALQHPTVATRLQETLSALTHLTTAFCTAITASIHKLPYALLYLAGVMRRALVNRFPHIMDKEILKVVGSLIYYRYINSGIVAPDAFDVVTVGPHEQLTSRQRRNLATIAKTLQAAATKRGFGSDSPHLCSLNPSLVSWHESFRAFFLSCCRVPGPEAVFAVTRYSEAALIHRPQMHITLQELHETHCLVLEHRSVLAPAADDPLHAVLDSLPAPDLQALGDSSGKTEVCLTLSCQLSLAEPPLERTASDNKDAHTKLFERSKQLAVSVLLCHGDGPVDWGHVTLQEAVIGGTASQQEQRYTVLKAAAADNCCDTLHAAKTRLSHNLRRLQTLGLVSPADGHWHLLHSIAADVLNQKCYRATRGKELFRLQIALRQLQLKESFMREQRDSYLTYLTGCRANLLQHCARRPRGSGGSGSSVTYSGKRLREKGVLVEIRDFTTSQYSSVAFVFSRVDQMALSTSGHKQPQLSKRANAKKHCSPQVTVSGGTEERDNRSNSDRRADARPAERLQEEGKGLTGMVGGGIGGGVFSVTVKYRGVEVDAVRVSIQELLHLQYEGVRVKQMAGAQVNVNLLLHLLNTKFFTKKK